MLSRLLNGLALIPRKKLSQILIDVVLLSILPAQQQKSMLSMTSLSLCAWHKNVAAAAAAAAAGIRTTWHMILQCISSRLV